MGKQFFTLFGVALLCAASSFLYSRSLLLEAYGTNAVALAKRGALAGFVLALVFGLVVSLLTARSGLKARHRLKSAASRMAAGDLSARARIAGHDELGKLGAALDQLAESLSSTLKQLRAERDRLDAVLSGMTEGVLLLDQDGRVALVNPALRSMSVIGTDVAGKAPIEVIRNAELSELLERARDSTTPVSGELELNTPTTARVLVRTRHLAGSQGGLVAVFVDVTDLRRLETLRRDFVANASHELRTPIASIHSAAETLVAGAGDQPETRARFLDIILRNAGRMHHLVDDMLDLSRLESRENKLLLVPVRISGTLQQVFATLSTEAQRKGIELSNELPGDLRVLAEPRSLEQVLLNLADNAVKYCPAGSQVRVRHEQQGDGIKIIVSDNGGGIETRHLQRLFERFYRVDAGRTREVGGTGLGLAIVKHLVEAMKGSVSVESELGKGTVFTVRLTGVWTPEQ